MPCEQRVGFRPQLTRGTMACAGTSCAIAFVRADLGRGSCPGCFVLPVGFCFAEDNVR
jgi:hypothetical protein